MMVLHRRLPGGTKSLLLVVLLAILGHVRSDESSAAAADASSSEGSNAATKPHSTVVTLTTDNFDAELADPANGLWLLKFYAPWCGHCKALAPILDKVAPYLEGKMAIGTVDCTREKKLCGRFDVRGYPTLKFHRDGTYYPYPGNRDADSIIDFAERMARDAVTVVRSYEEALDVVAGQSPEGVGFVAYDPDAVGETVEELVQSTKFLQVFRQAARKMQADASFGLLSPDADDDDAVDAFGATPERRMKGGQFMAKVERDADTKFFAPPLQSMAHMAKEVEMYVKEHNVALVTELGPRNFKTMGDRQMPVAIAVYDPEDTTGESEKLLSDLRTFARSGPPSIRYRYLYARMDGKRWGKFLGQFGIESGSVPQLFVLHIADRKYFQDSSVGGVEEFLTAVAERRIEEREQKGPEGGPLKVLERAFMRYMPWSLGGVLFLVGVMMWFVLPSSEDLEEVVVQSEEGESKEESKKEK